MSKDRWYNPIVRWLLRSPFHWLVSSSVALVTFTGRKSGRVYNTPISYARHGQLIQLISQRGRAWWHNLEGGAPVVVRVKGQDLPGTATVVDLSCDDMVQALCDVYHGLSHSKARQLAGETVLIRIRLAGAESNAAPEAIAAQAHSRGLR